MRVPLGPLRVPLRAPSQVLLAFDKFSNNHFIGTWPAYTKALKTQSVAAATFFTAKAVRIIEVKQSKAEKRTKLQCALSELTNFRGSEDDLHAVLKTAVEKNMRV